MGRPQPSLSGQIPGSSLEHSQVEVSTHRKMPNKETTTKRKGKPSRKRVHGIDRRQALIDAGLKLLATSSAEPKVEDITLAAGTAKGTFYTYFSSWDVFLAEVRNALLVDYASHMQERTAAINQKNYWQHLEREVLYYLRWAQDQHLLHQRVFHAGLTEEIPPDVSASRAIENLIQAGITLGLVRSGLDMPVVAPLVFQTVHAAAALANSKNVKSVSRTTADYIRAALQA